MVTAKEIAEWLEDEKAATTESAIAQMMIRCSLATGHGDTVEDLLMELEAQIKELRDRAEKAEAFVAEYRDHVRPYWKERAEKAEAELALTDKEADATSDLLSAAVDKCRALEAELAQARKALEDIVSFYDGPTEAKRPDFFERLMNRARVALKGEPK